MYIQEEQNILLNQLFHLRLWPLTFSIACRPLVLSNCWVLSQLLAIYFFWVLGWNSTSFLKASSNSSPWDVAPCTHSKSGAFKNGVLEKGTKREKKTTKNMKRCIGNYKPAGYTLCDLRNSSNYRFSPSNCRSIQYCSIYYYYLGNTLTRFLPMSSDCSLRTRTPSAPWQRGSLHWTPSRHLFPLPSAWSSIGCLFF